MLVSLLVAACRGHEEEPRPAPERVVEPPPADFATHEKVVAVAPGGAVFVTRAANKLHAWARTGKLLAAVDALAEDERTAISAKGDLLAEASDRAMRVLELPSGRALWQHDEVDTVWGDLAFARSGQRLAIPFTGTVRVIEPVSGREVTTFDRDHVGAKLARGDGLTIPRQIVYSPDGLHLTIRCSRDAEMPENHTLYVAVAPTGVIEDAIPGHVGELFATAWVSNDRVATVAGDGTVRVIHDGAVERTLALAAHDYQQLVVSADLRIVAAAADDIVVWRKGMQTVTIPRGKPDDPVVYLEVSDASVLALSLHGELDHYAIPAPAAAASDWVVVDDATRAREAALWAIARGEQVAIAGDDPIAVSARAYASGAPIRGPISLDLVSRWLGGGFVYPARDLYLAWLASRADDLRGVPVGLQLRAALETRDDGTAPLTAAMLARWPNDPRVAEPK